MREKFTLSAGDWLTITRPAAWTLWIKNSWQYLSAAVVGLFLTRFAIPPLGNAAYLLYGFCFFIAATGLWIAVRPTAEEARKFTPESKRQGDSSSDVNPQPAAAKRVVLDRVGGGRYELLGLTGHNDEGDVYEAFDTKRAQAVTVKKLPGALATDNTIVARLTQAIQAAAPLAHAAILQTYEVFQDRQDVYVAMEFAPGDDLQTKITRDGRFSPRTAIPVGRGIAEGLAAAHARGIAHADLNPLHINLDSEGHPKITAFGFVNLPARHLPTGGSMTGSPAYTSPEQAQGKPADARSDIYSFGITLYYMLTGRPPFEGDASELLARHITDRVPALPDVPADLDALLHKCTHPDPARRYQDGAALVTAFRRLQGEIA